MMPPIVDEKAAQKAVTALIKALGVPEGNLSRVEIECGGSVKVYTRDRAYFRVARVEPFNREETP